MSKYSYEPKLKIVQEYLNGPLGSHLLTKKYNIPSDTPIKNWINQYKKYEKDALKNIREDS